MVADIQIKSKTAATQAQSVWRVICFYKAMSKWHLWLLFQGHTLQRKCLTKTRRQTRIQQERKQSEENNLAHRLQDLTGELWEFVRWQALLESWLSHSHCTLASAVIYKPSLPANDLVTGMVRFHDGCLNTSHETRAITEGHGRATLLWWHKCSE